MPQSHARENNPENHMHVVIASSSNNNGADVKISSQKKSKSVKYFKCGKYYHSANECHRKTINHHTRKKYPKYRSGKYSINCVADYQI